MKIATSRPTQGFSRTVCSGIALLASAILFPLPAYADNETARLHYRKFCVPCHGTAGKGDGPGARSLPVRPADHTDGAVMNARTDNYLYEIIAKGGTAVGKTPFMPAWKNQFDEKQIRDLVAYIRSLANPPYRGAKRHPD